MCRSFDILAARISAMVTRGSLIDCFIDTVVDKGAWAELMYHLPAHSAVHPPSQQANTAAVDSSRYSALMIWCCSVHLLARAENWRCAVQEVEKSPAEMDRDSCSIDLSSLPASRPSSSSIAANGICKQRLVHIVMTRHRSSDLITPVIKRQCRLSSVRS
jgi:hypothetical protein